MNFKRWYGSSSADLDELEMGDFADPRDISGDTLDPRKLNSLKCETIHTDEECEILDSFFDDDDIDDDMII